MEKFASLAVTEQRCSAVASSIVVLRDQAAMHMTCHGCENGMFVTGPHSQLGHALCMLPAAAATCAGHMT